MATNFAGPECLTDSREAGKTAPPSTATRKLLLICSSAPPAISGAPLMAYNILKHFPLNSFAILTSHVGLDNRSIEGGPRLQAKYFYFDTPTMTTVAERDEHLFQKCKRLLKRFRAVKSVFHFIALFWLPLNIVRRGKKIIAQEKIDCLLAFSDHGPALISTYLLHKITGKPFAVHFYDLYKGNNFLWFFRLASRIFEPRLFRSAEQISAMCEGLAEYYRAQYGREVTVIYNSIPIDLANKPQPMQAHAEPFKIIYSGTIAWAQAKALTNLARAVDGLSAPKVVLYLYTPHPKSYLEPQGLFESDRVVFARGLPHEMPAIHKSADILFVGLAFNTEHPVLINTSSPGKTCEYLVSGRPILVHAPKESYIARYATQNQFACVVDEDNVEALRDAILRLVSDKEYVSKMLLNAWSTALLNHDAGAQSEKFQRCLLSGTATVNRRN